MVPAGEKVKPYHDALWEEAKQLVKEEFDEKLELYVSRLKQADRAIQGHAFKE